MNAGEDQSDVLKEANMNEVSNGDCGSIWAQINITDNMICAQGFNGRTCGGDSGMQYTLHLM